MMRWAPPRPYAPTMLHVLVVDDEAPALEEQAYLLRRDARVLDVTTAASGEEALRALEHGKFDAVFLDIRMPGLDGRDVSRLIARFADPPDVVFVTAFEDFALDAFELEATDYVLKPVRAERLAEAVRRVAQRRQAPAAAGSASAEVPDEMIEIELGGLFEKARDTHATRPPRFPSRRKPGARSEATRLRSRRAVGRDRCA